MDSQREFLLRLQVSGTELWRKEFISRNGLGRSFRQSSIENRTYTNQNAIPQSFPLPKGKPASWSNMPIELRLPQFPLARVRVPQVVIDSNRKTLRVESVMAKKIRPDLVLIVPAD